MTQHILRLIASITPYDPLEAAHIQETISWIKSGAPIFRIQKPDIPRKHLVSYFVVFDERAAKVLLVDHKKAGLWLPSGGHVEINEDPTENVRRECWEELQIPADFYFNAPFFLTATETVGSAARHTDVSLWYILKGDHRDIYDFDQTEFHGVQWFDLNDIPYETSDPHMGRFVEKWKLFIN